MAKSDLGKQYKAYYTAKNKPELVHIDPARFINICGKGDPSGAAFADNLQALYSTAYTLKFACKAIDLDFVVAKLEGLWSFDETTYKDLSMEEAPTSVPRSEWDYRLMLRIPDFVTAEMLQNAIKTVVSIYNVNS